MAYAAYAKAANQAQWYEAIATFEAASRPRLVAANFKALALLAGAPNPKRSEYAARFKTICETHALDCVDEHWIARFVPTVMSGGKAQEEFSTVAKRAESAPSELYFARVLHVRVLHELAGCAHISGSGRALRSPALATTRDQCDDMHDANAIWRKL